MKLNAETTPGRDASIRPDDMKPDEILVVDDEKHIRRTLKHMLEKLGYRVWLADNGLNAIELIRQEDIDLVISDINMPEMNGLELVRIVNESFRPPEILLITGEPSLESATSAVKLGVFDYVSKPLDADALIHTVLRAIEKKKLLDQKDHLLRENQRYQQKLEKTLDQRTFHLMQTEEKYRGLFENANIGLGIMNPSYQVLESNPTLSKITGYPGSTLQKMKLPELFQRQSSATKMMAILDQHDKVDQFEGELLRAGNTPFWASITLKKIKYQGFSAVLVTLLEISDQKRYEQSLKRAIQDKEEMLGEIHHRTKNNMNVIISILNLQANSIEDEKVKGALDQVSNRIFAMSLVHEQIYTSKELSHIELAPYMRSLIAKHYSTGKKSLKDVHFIQNYADIAIGLSQAIPLGLAMNEIISNAIKHPFRDDPEGEISLTINMTEANEIYIKLEDSGPGFPDTVDLNDPQSLGLHMVKILAEDQLMGSVKFSNSPGATISITFPYEATPIFPTARTT